jgi:2,5-dioxopentanoate dehydrogenase
MSVQTNDGLKGKHLIGGQWIGSDETFMSDPASGPAHEFSVGSASLVDQACQLAEQAFDEYSNRSRQDRAKFLEVIADEIDARGAVITQIGTQETGLPETRIEGERGRTTGQLRLFADHIRQGDYLECRHDPALPERAPAPRPDIRMMQRPVGPVAVFGASNFPLAFSVAGGDTAAALAAGCPVVVKGHSAHPGTGEIVADAIRAAIEATGMPAGVFSLIQGGNRKVGEALVQHPLIKAVGFTGSLTGGRALFNLCAARPEPIPFFGELGSANPMFLLPHGLSAKAEDIGKAWVGSLTMGAGQFCTNPGIAVLIDNSDADRFVTAAAMALEQVAPQTMLTNGIAQAFKQGRAQLTEHDGVCQLMHKESEGRSAGPALFETSGDTFLADRGLSEEIFGPAALVVRVSSAEEMVELAHGLEGQLTATIHMDADDTALAQSLRLILERKAGRILFNGFPTGVEVVDAMVHGGPYPASTNFGATSVGTLSIRRWLRPVAYQNMPQELFPEGLKA